jgi:hypothetical protein
VQEEELHVCFGKSAAQLNKELFVSLQLSRTLINVPLEILIILEIEIPLTSMVE